MNRSGGTARASNRSENVTVFAILFLGLFVLNALFWFLADFGSFVPASNGPFEERLYFTIVSAVGPLAWCVRGLALDIDLFEDIGVLCWLVALSMSPIASLFYPRSRILRVLAVISIVIWFVAGCGRTTLRIT